MGRNWQWSIEHGREQRLKLERESAEQGIAECDIDRTVPLHSHDATMQAYFAQGWRSVTPADVYQARNKHRFKILTTGNDKVAMHCANLRSLFNKDAS
jgi:hypothetical protein